MDNQIYYNQSVRIMKDIDTSGGKVAAYFATFDDVDSHGRMMDKNAFRRTIKNNAAKWKHLYNHDPNRIVGKVLDAGTDSVGAFFVSKINNTSHGKDLMELYNDGTIDEHSFGFHIVHSVQNSDHELVKEARVIEVSSVTWAANPNAGLISLNAFDDVEERIKNITRQLDEMKALLPETPQDSQRKESDLLNLINTFNY